MPVDGTVPARARSSEVLPAPLGPTSAAHSPAATVEVHPLERHPPVVADPDPLGGDAAHGPHPRRLERSTTAKKGAPTKAVITPRGTSAGATRVARPQVGQHQEGRPAQDRQRQ